MLFFNKRGMLSHPRFSVSSYLRECRKWSIYPQLPPKNVLDIYNYYISHASVNFNFVQNTSLILSISYCIPSKISANKTSVFNLSHFEDLDSKNSLNLPTIISPPTSH